MGHIGTYEHRIDAKYRVVLPAKIREKLGDVAVVAAGLDNCISLFSEEDWNNFAEKIKKLPFYSNAKFRDFARVMLGSAHETPLDGMGRILLPAVLREYAQLKQEVVISGAGDHAEIWDRDRWAAKWRNGLENLAEMAADVEGF
ncbi:MAG: division/cell wall cluster transcriptional repressor MraZ [Synergistaceae bacterium]|jgi:MraZ protein|nr:division/cell wall cluster transcriptional repressor MraZ [Synergistaceae bacterium]